MTFEEVKTSIEQKQLDDKLLIFKYTDIPFVAYQYVNEISSFKKLQIEYIEDLSTIENSVVDIFGTSDIKTGIRVYSCDEFNSTSVDLKNEKNIYVITKKISDNKIKSLFEDNIIYIPKLEDWQIKDYVYSVAEGVSKDNLDWFLSICNDIYRIDNELDKLRLFDINEQKYLFEDMKYEGSFNDLSSFNVFNITNSVTSRDMSMLHNALREIKNFDAEPLGIVTLLYQGFKRMIQVLLSKNPTPESTGLKSNVIYAISKSPKVYTKKQMIDAFQFLNSIDKMLKTGKIDIKWLVDYVVCKVLTV